MGHQKFLKGSKLIFIRMRRTPIGK